MSRIAFPFLNLGSTAVRTTPWMLLDERGDVPVGEWLADWDMARDIRLRRTVILDFDQAAEQLQLPADDLAFDVRVRFGTGPGNMPRLLFDGGSHRLDRNQPEALFEELISGGNLSKRLVIETHVLLAAPAGAGGALSPQRPSSRLWTDRHDLRLEGEEPRFPMEITSFSERFAGRPEMSAPWLLHWTPGDLDRDFGGAVRLFLNSDRKDFSDRFIDGDRSTLQVVLADTMVQLIGSVVMRDDFDTTTDAEEGSIAWQARMWMDLAFPGRDAAGVRSTLELRPSDFHAAILAAADIVTEETAE